MLAELYHRSGRLSFCAGTRYIYDNKIDKKGTGMMAKSKLVAANEKIAEKVVDRYKKIEDTVVDTYKKIEDTVVGSYTKIENSFVDHYLTREGETVEEAKERLKREKKDGNK